MAGKCPAASQHPRSRCDSGRGKAECRAVRGTSRERKWRATGGPVLNADGDLLEGSLADIEKQVIVEKLKRCHGNRKKSGERAWNREIHIAREVAQMETGVRRRPSSGLFLAGLLGLVLSL